MKKILAVALLTVSWARADDWVCKSDGSYDASATSVVVCGVASGRDEFSARLKSLTAALTEFNVICDASDSCKNRKIVVVPKRTDCSKRDDEFTCYRAVRVEVTNEIKNARVELAELRAAAKTKDDDAALTAELRQTNFEDKLRAGKTSFWNFGAGLNVNSAKLNGTAFTQTNYGVALKYCFAGVVCPGVSATLGKLANSSVFGADVVTGVTTLSVFVSNRVYLQGGFGGEYRFTDKTAELLGLVTGTIGVEAVKVGAASLNLEGGVKGGPQVSVTPVFGASLNFKF